jgi:hypothetical protein
MGFQGVKIYKAPPPKADAPPAGKKTGWTPAAMVPTAITPFFANLFRQTFGDNLPDVLKPKKRKSAAQKAAAPEVAEFADVPPNAFTAIQFGAVAYDYGGFYDPAKPDRLTIPAGLGGVYDMEARVHFVGSKAGGVVYSWLVRSEMECVDMSVLGYSPGQDATVGPLLTRDPFAAGDYFQVVVLHAFDKPAVEGALKFGTWFQLARRPDQVETPPPAPGPTPGPTPTPVRQVDLDDEDDPDDVDDPDDDV